MDVQELKKQVQDFNKNTTKPWGPIASILLSIQTYIISLSLGTILISLYPVLRGWGTGRSDDWISESIAQFWLIIIVDGLVLLIIWWLLRARKQKFSSIGLRRFKLTDLLYAVLGFSLYFLIYVVVAVLVKIIFPEVNFDQNQQLGFETTKSLLQLSMIFLSLVIIPPVVEEILFRGFLYTGISSKWPKWLATLIVSVMFAIAHLQFGSGAPLLWVAAIDTFSLSLVLTYLREKTGGLGAPILLHGIKNAIAFTLLFIVGVV